MNKLNPAQRDAVTTLKGPLLVLAGAGTGKTRVVTFRIAELIRHRIKPERILAVTFTNKAAGEMRERAMALLGKKTEERPEISTFHSLCVKILRRHIRHLGYPSQFAIYDRGDQEGVARSVLREISGSEGILKPSDLLYFVSRWKNSCVRPDEAANLAETDKEHLASIAYRRYQNALKAAGAVDFDDLLLCTEELFTKYTKVRQAEADRFDHLLVDEYQDTNGSQYRIVKALAGGHRNLCVVGDDDQSIYGWRGAEVAHILQFKRDWPEAKVVRLETNYRSTHEILAWANRLIAFNKLRHGKVLKATKSGEPPRILQLDDEELEAKTVVGEIAQRIREKIRRAKDFAILCRTNEQPRAFEMELRRAKVPYVLIGGMSFYDRKEIRDILAYLKLLANPADEVSLLRIINTPARGIGQSTVKRLMEAAIERRKPLWEILPRLESEAVIAPPAAAAVVKFRDLIERYRQLAGAAPRPAASGATAGLSGSAGNTAGQASSGTHRSKVSVKPPSLVDVLKKLLADIDYKAEIVRMYPAVQDQESREASLEELVNAMGTYCGRTAKPTLAGFLQDIALTGNEEDRDKESKLERDAVALMTMHAAKGLEFPEVYMVGMEEGQLPHHRSVAADGAAIDEERRLCYVGVTRAQERLTLSLALNRNKWGKARPTTPSRFLYEITGKAENPNYLEIKARGGGRGARGEGRGARGGGRG